MSESSQAQYAVMGSPISHSLSPQIHQAFAKESHLTIEYNKTEVHAGQLAQTLANFRANNGQGTNITLPLKEEAFALCQHTSVYAQKAQAVNTLYWNAQDELCGDNTDGRGLVQDLNHHDQQLEGKSILILGAGGASAGIIGPLLEQQPHSIVIANRTVKRAISLAERFQDARVIASGLDSLTNSFDVVINATSLSLQNQLPIDDIKIINQAFVYDLSYDRNKDTSFVAWAKQNGAKQAIDGLGMLVEQAAISFKIWHGVQPHTHAVLTMLRQL